MLPSRSRAASWAGVVGATEGHVEVDGSRRRPRFARETFVPGNNWNAATIVEQSAREAIVFPHPAKSERALGAPYPVFHLCQWRPACAAVFRELALAEPIADGELWAAGRRDDRSNPIGTQMATEGGTRYQGPELRAAIVGSCGRNGNS